jgi:hypothetical protein
MSLQTLLFTGISLRRHAAWYSWSFITIAPGELPEGGENHRPLESLYASEKKRRSPLARELN